MDYQDERNNSPISKVKVELEDYLLCNYSRLLVLIVKEKWEIYRTMKTNDTCSWTPVF